MKVFVRNPNPLPFLIDPMINQTISNFYRTNYPRSVMILTGSYKSGKTSILKHFFEEEQKSPHLPLFLDFSTAKNAEEMKNQLRCSLIQAIRLYLNRNSQKRINIQELSSIYQPMFASITKFMDGEFSFRQFVADTQDLFPNQTLSIFLNDVMNLKSLMPTLSNSLLYSFSDFDMYESKTHILMEYSDPSIHYMNFSPHYQIISVSDVKDPFLFVEPFKSFSNAEMKKILYSIGPHGGEIESIFQEVKKGKTIDQAIQNRYSYISKMISNLTHSPKFCTGGYLTFNEHDSIELIRKGYFFIDEKGVLYPANKIVHKCACK